MGFSFSMVMKVVAVRARAACFIMKMLRRAMKMQDAPRAVNRVNLDEAANLQNESSLLHIREQEEAFITSKRVLDIQLRDHTTIMWEEDQDVVLPSYILHHYENSKIKTMAKGIPKSIMGFAKKGIGILLLRQQEVQKQVRKSMLAHSKLNEEIQNGQNFLLNGSLLLEKEKEIDNRYFEENNKDERGEQEDSNIIMRWGIVKKTSSLVHDYNDNNNMPSLYILQNYGHGNIQKMVADIPFTTPTKKGLVVVVTLQKAKLIYESQSARNGLSIALSL